MANENLDPKELRSLGKDILATQGDFNDLLKDSIKNLSKMTSSYDGIIAKINTMNKGVINTKKIQGELDKARAKENLSIKQLADVEKQLSLTQKSRAERFLDIQKKVQKQLEKVKQVSISGSVQELKIEQRKLNSYDSLLDVSKAALGPIEGAYLLQKNTLDQSQKLTKEIVNRLESEKELEKTIGKTGQFIGFMNKRFGIFKDTYTKIVEEAREDNTQTLTKIKLLGITTALMVGLVKLGQKVANTLSTGLKSLVPTGGTSPISSFTSGISSMLKSIPYLGGLLGGVVDIFSSILDVVIGIDDVIIKSGRNLNLNTTEARKLYEKYADISILNGDIFLTSKKFLESQVELGQALGINNELSTETLATNIKLKDIAGLDAGLRADIAENAIVSGKSSEDLVKSVGAQVIGLKNATGISLNFQKVLGEANKLGGYLGLAFAKYPEKISKALVTTKALGTSLKEMDSIADSFLDFEGSISKQFEAQLLTGKDINLQEARRAFLNNDLATAAIEINKQVGSSAEFLHMNRIAATSMAESFGMSRDQLGEMLKKQEMLSKLGAKDTDNARTQLKLGLERYKTQEALSAALGNDVYNNLVNASTQEKIAAFIDKIKTSLVDFIEKSGLINKIQSFIDYLSNPQNIKGILTTVKNIVAGAISFFGDLFAMLSEGISHLPFTDKTKWQGYAASIRAGSEISSTAVRSVGGEMISVSPAAANNQVGATNPGATSPAGVTNQGNQPINVYMQPQFSVDGQPMHVQTIKNAQSSGPVDNSGGQWSYVQNYSLSGQHK